MLMFYLLSFLRQVLILQQITRERANNNGIQSLIVIKTRKNNEKDAH